MESPRAVTEDISILPSYLPIPGRADERRVADETYPGLPAGAPLQSLRLSPVVVALMAVIGLMIGLVVIPHPRGERIVHTADGAAWTASDIAAFIRGRLGDENGRRYCEHLLGLPQLDALREDQAFLDRLTRDLCVERLAEDW